MQKEVQQQQSPSCNCFKTNGGLVCCCCCCSKADATKKFPPFYGPLLPSRLEERNTSFLALKNASFSQGGPFAANVNYLCNNQKKGSKKLSSGTCS